ncbi:glycosyl hydrolase [Pedobacter sp. SYSU D00535]|uniref:glycosyl hydrolase n=1 Tax=Pedobacter sp. SYSU D00535 TaxID=2810308 RepID=UPI001A97435D|nr:glycosyl hydrolase [Pedobacter sp. SYSU D00535]
MSFKGFRFFAVLFSLVLNGLLAQAQTSATAKPWVLWYWMHGAASKEGITADLEAMKEVGIGGAYLMPIKGPTNPPLFTPVAAQLSPLWWEMVKHAVREADRLGLKIGMNVSDGFATAGGPWITPELSMQKVVSSQTYITGGTKNKIKLPQPETKENYYRDIAVYAFPSVEGAGVSSRTVVPKVTTSTGIDASFLVKAGNKEAIRSNNPLWIQYEFAKPFTARTVFIHTNGNNVQAHRLKIEVSDDGKAFRSIGRLQPPRHGWQDTDADITHSIVPTTARYFRFSYDKAGSEPGAEDLDAAKWKPSLKLVRLELSSEPRIHQFEGKSGAVWRISERTDANQIPNDLCVPLSSIVNLTDRLNPDGSLNWTAPKGDWTIIRVGHTSTGHTNATGGAAKGLELDKFNAAAVKLHFSNWFGEALKQVGPDLTPRVLNTLFMDSWEAGSQNWSPVFRDEFKKRRGYDLLPYLPVMAGIPIESAEVSEKFLYDVRKTIAELIPDVYFKTVAQSVKERGILFSAENVSPTMVSDGILHFKTADMPTGEFWLNSPTHDKPNDMLDAISGAHVYGKNIVQSEAFTTVRMAWDEYPGMMKTLQDRNYALGINRLVYHVFTHNPWMNRKPGMTLDGVGLYFQRDQTWWKQGKAWVQYAERAQELLQQGKPVRDIAVFMGEELPRRSVLPDRLVPFLPGIFGEDVMKAEEKRLANIGEPLRQIPAGVNHSANMADPENWVNPLRGYAYDSFNPDALSTSKVENGEVVFESGARYKLLILPGKRKMNPEAQLMSLEVATKLRDLANEGATIMIAEKPTAMPGLQAGDAFAFDRVVNELWNGDFYAIRNDVDTVLIKKAGKGRIIKGKYIWPSFYNIGLNRDLDILDSTEAYPKGIAWNHRRAEGKDIYFISNQLNEQRTLNFSFRVKNAAPELYDAVTGKTSPANQWKPSGDRTELKLQLEPNASLFVIFNDSDKAVKQKTGKNWTELEPIQTIAGDWKVSFDTSLGGPPQPVTFKTLDSWSTNQDSLIKYYSGTAAYTTSFNTKKRHKGPVYLDLGEVANIAEVKVNGVSCGIVWTAPYRVDISKALKKGNNQLTVEVTNTWANRLMGDQRLPEDKRITKTTAPYRLEGKPLLKAGLFGPVTLLKED